MLRVALYVWQLRINVLPIFIWKKPLWTQRGHPSFEKPLLNAADGQHCLTPADFGRCKAAGPETSTVLNSILLHAAVPGAPPAWGSLQLPAPPSSGTSPPESWTFFHTINFPHTLPCSIALENSCSSFFALHAGEIWDTPIPVLIHPVSSLCQGCVFLSFPCLLLISFPHSWWAGIQSQQGMQLRL